MPSWAFLRAFLARRDVIPGRTLPSGLRAMLAVLLPNHVDVGDAGLLEQVPPHRQGFDRMLLEEVVRELRQRVVLRPPPAWLADRALHFLAPIMPPVREPAILLQSICSMSLRPARPMRSRMLGIFI